MPTPLFEPGNKLAKGGARPGSGRPPKGKQTAAELVRTIIEGNAKKLSDQYIERALGKFGSDRVLCHAIDKLLPNEQTSVQTPSITINYIRFDNTVELQAKELPVTVLASDAIREESGRPSLASPGGQGQNGVKFHNFKDVP